MSEATPAQKGTRYLVLRLEDEASGTFAAVGWIVAASSTEAVRNVAKDNGEFYAVPERSWKPVKVTVSTETIVKLG